ncbi:DUF1957 domain-containing protein [candidate division KSB1 bacterium]|nr:DUF1957 domain-containing protein [candidate division KSB1 bacterium]
MTHSPVGYFSFVLHSHLPYVLSHGSWPHGTDWLNEATAETYIPILNCINECIEQGIQPRLTIGISPVLAEQLDDEAFKAGFDAYLQIKIDAALADQKTFKKQRETELFELAHWWETIYRGIRRDFVERYQRDLITEFRRLLNKGYLDIFTCGATHGYFPLLSQDTSIRAQVKMAIKCHQRHFGRKPRGIWLPECAYRPRYAWAPPVDSAIGRRAYPRKGVDEFLSENGIEYFFVDSSTLKGGKAIGVYIARFEGLQQLWEQYERAFNPREEDFEKSCYESYQVNSMPETHQPVSIFARDPETGIQVWSGTHGYPGDGWYLDFHKKNFPGGLRYWRVTDSRMDMADKKRYHPEKIDERLFENAAHFVGLIKQKLTQYHQSHAGTGFLAAPFDTELFGHWWFEGIGFIKKVIQRIANDPDIRLATCAEVLDRRHSARLINLPEGSWGEGGYHFIWLNKDTDWTWIQLYTAEMRMQMLARSTNHRQDEKVGKIVRQAARELMLAQASDWQFLITTRSAADYAETRFSKHIADFNRLADMAENYERKKALPPDDWEFLERCQMRDALFPDIDIEWFASVELPAI